MKTIKKVMHRILQATFLILICVFAWQPTALAYFDQGPVGVSVGRQSVTLTQGQSENISITFSPGSSSQLPGCGMAECPQTCGEKECLDENGQCSCNGKTYQTYYAYAVVTSSNTSVATAEYDDNGVVTINAVSPGTATITVTASLRQFTSTSTTIEVTVEAESDPNAAGDPGNSGTVGDIGAPNGSSVSDSSGDTGDPSPSKEPDASGSQSPGVIVTQVAGNSGEETEVEDMPAASEEPYTVVESMRGTIYFVPITEDKMGGDLFKEIIGKESYIDFQKKDAAENILYAWEFCGVDLTETEDVVLTLDTSTTAFSGCTYCDSSDALYISFSEDGPLPGDASLYLPVSGMFTDEDVLYLYSYGDDGELTLLADGISAENGYIAMTLAFKSNLILTAQDLAVSSAFSGDKPETTPDTTPKTTTEDKPETERDPVTGQGGISPVWIVLIVIAVLLVIGAVFVIIYRSQKKRKGHTND